MRHIRLVAVTSACALLLALLPGCGTGPGSPYATGTPPPSPSPTAGPTGQANPAASAPHCPVGVRCYRGDTAVTVHQVNRTTEAKASATLQPGRTYLTIDVTIQNIGQYVLYCSPQYFRIRDAAGVEYTPNALITQGAALSPSELWPDDQVRGNVTFEVPADAAGLQAIYQPPDQEESTWISVYLGR